MGKESIIASKEDLKGITLDEKAAIDAYVEEVNNCIFLMKNAVDAMIATGDTMDDIRGVLKADFDNLNKDLKKLESLSEQLNEKAQGYQKFIDTLRGLK